MAGGLAARRLASARCSPSTSTRRSPALVAIAVHGVTLLGDRWLHPGLAGIAVPFAMGYRPSFTGLGHRRAATWPRCSA